MLTFSIFPTKLQTRWNSSRYLPWNVCAIDVTFCAADEEFKLPISCRIFWKSWRANPITSRSRRVMYVRVGPESLFPSRTISSAPMALCWRSSLGRRSAHMLICLLSFFVYLKRKFIVREQKDFFILNNGNANETTMILGWDSNPDTIATTILQYALPIKLPRMDRSNHFYGSVDVYF